LAPFRERNLQQTRKKSVVGIRGAAQQPRKGDSMERVFNAGRRKKKRPAACEIRNFPANHMGGWAPKRAATPHVWGELSNQREDVPIASPKGMQKTRGEEGPLGAQESEKDLKRSEEATRKKRTGGGSELRYLTKIGRKE